MTIQSIETNRYSAGSAEERISGTWREALPYLLLLVALGLASAVAAVADPQAFGDIFSGL